MRTSEASFLLVAGTAPVAAPRHQVSGCTCAGERKFGLAKARRQKIGERLGAPTVLVMGVAKRLWPWIVVHIPRNLEGRKVSLTESSSGRLEFKLSHIRLTGSAELRSECYSGMVMFGRRY
jgi:hypothetical protein